jgi:hypothetical protein
MCIYLCETPKTRVCIRYWPSSYLRHICFRVFFSHRTTIKTYIKNAFLCTMDLVLFHNNIGFCRFSRSTSPHKVYCYVDLLFNGFLRYSSNNFFHNWSWALDPFESSVQVKFVYDVEHIWFNRSKQFSMCFN